MAQPIIGDCYVNDKSNINTKQNKILFCTVFVSKLKFNIILNICITNIFGQFTTGYKVCSPSKLF